jgi:hypothetical protein
MSDNFDRQSQTFRAEEKSSVLFPVVLVGAQVRTYVGTESITSTGSSQGLTVPSGAEFADIYCESDADTSTDYVRYWHNSEAPTSTVGVKLKDHEVLQSGDPSTFRFMSGNGSGTCTLRVEYYKYV